ncbi:MAG TPA: hypothetical protein VHZ06_00730 [Marmoricola sp.]|jgi:hypothetical protein|nr:hypothetical protein [Marmoricola sp.]
MTANQADEPVREREEDEDHDLLTYGEAGVRLAEEVVALRAKIADLTRADADTTSLSARLVDLEAALARNSRQPINDETFERFFGYKGTARRNT